MRNKQIHLLGLIFNQKWKNKIYKLWKVNDRNAVVQPDRGTRNKAKPRCGSKKMVRGIRFKIRLKISRNILGYS